MPQLQNSIALRVGTMSVLERTVLQYSALKYLVLLEIEDVL